LSAPARQGVDADHGGILHWRLGGAGGSAIGGSSDWFERGFVTYSDAAKQGDAWVSAYAAAHDRVSERRRSEMAIRLAHSRAQVAVAIRGLPARGGSAEKPVGMVCFAWAKKGTWFPL
jgi:nicotinamide-nucleotide amidase